MIFFTCLSLKLYAYIAILWYLLVIDAEMSHGTKPNQTDNQNLRNMAF